MDTVRKYLPDVVVVHINNSNVINPREQAFEGISRVSDGYRNTECKSAMGNGYYVTEATALTKCSQGINPPCLIAPIAVPYLSLYLNPYVAQ